MKVEVETSRKRRFKGRGMFLIPILLLIPGLVWIVHSLVEKGERRSTAPQLSLETPARNPLVNFEDFLIPMETPSKHALISLSFSLQLPNGPLEKVVEQRMKEIRGFIYDTLREEFRKSEDIPSVQAVKDGVVRAIGLVLPELQVNDVYISRFLAL